METRIISKEELIDDEEVTVWRIIEGNTVLANINKVLNESISECEWLDDTQTRIKVDYTTGDDRDLIAIIGTNGFIFKKEISSIVEHIEEHNLLLVIMSGQEGDHSTFGILETDGKWAVIDYNGDYVLVPEYDMIEYDGEIFITDGGTFSIEGNSIEEE